MKTDATDGEDKANAKPPLVCAPCYVCLEDGADEAGEPLVRDCSCRGETSAGYHLSCIIKYAKCSTQRLINRGWRGNTEKDVAKSWGSCPNCKGPYQGTVCNRMLDAMMESTEHLPNTHWVRFYALDTLVIWRLHVLTKDVVFGSTESKEYSPPFDEIETLLKVVEKEAPALLFSMMGSRSTSDRVQTFRLVYGPELLRRKANLYELVGEYEKALCCYDIAVGQLIIAKLCGCDVEEMLYIVRSQLHFRKFKMGLTNPKDDVKQLRGELAAQTAPSVQMTIKLNLARALTKLDPPEYFEAIKLLGEASATSNLIWGPEHSQTSYFKQQLANFKEDYRAYLQSIAMKK